MNERKRQSINALAGAIAEAESKLYNEDSTDLNGLRALLNGFLNKDDSPERVRLRREFAAGHPTTGPEGLRRKLGAIDMEFFGRAYFPHYFSRPSPEFHRELDAIWQQGVLKGRYPLTAADTKTISRLPGVRRAVAAPRGHAKSTNLTFKGTMHSTLYGYKHYPIIISDSSEQAEGFLDNIRVEFEENTAILEDFGPLAGSVWRSNVLVTKTNIKIEAIGSGKKIRGRKHRNWRPDLIILDDVENDENVRTPEQRKKLKDWFDKAVSKCGDDYTDIVYIGTLLHYDSLLAKTLANPAYRSIKYKAVIRFSQADDLWQQWETIFTDLSNDDREADALAFFQAHKTAMLEGTQVLWEEKLSYYDLMVMRVSEGEASFNSEEQNEPINPDDCLFMEEWFDYYNEAEVNFGDPAFDFFGFIDPSLGKTKRSDFSAIVTLAKHKGSGYMYVVDADIERRHPDRIIADVLAKERWLRASFGHGYRKLGAETNQFQWFLKEELAKASAKAGLYLPIEEVQQTSDKVMRVQTLQPDVKNKYIKFNRRHKRLLEQLTQFPMGAHDDGPDALEGARSIAKKVKRFRILDRAEFGI
ncbi:phage terminase large subunit [Flavonifractor plautii]|uniref:phage terminase large subunit n=1 Tax=Flavonifractor plautii TaxID=292800 RepID=UPI001896F091|nr:phage terminase large subunit [Flavonifractor plautii]DAW71098.1 MAG TPA: Large Terminase [Caudoviricetes sp.]